MRKPLVALVAAGSIGWPCALSEGALGPRYGGSVVVGMPEIASSLDPTVPFSSAHSLVLGLIHETLVTVDSDGFPAPSLAEGWNAAASGKEWTISLRDGATFHDGRPITAADAARSCLRFLKSGSSAAAQLASLLADDSASIDAPDERHLVLRLNRPASQPLAPLASLGAAITGPSGTPCGPFRPVHLIPAQRLSLAGFHAHVRGRPFLDGMTVVALADRALLRAEYQLGHADLIPGEGSISSLASSLVLVLDPTTPPFADEATRASVAAAVHRDDLMRHFLPGGVLSPSLLPSSLLPVPAEPALPSDATLSGAITLIVSRDVPTLASQRVVASLNALGMQVAVRPTHPRDAITARAEARLLLFLPEVAEPGLALQELASLVPPVREVQAGLEAATIESDPDRRRGLLLRAEAAMRNMCTLIGVASVPVSFASRPGLHGARVAPNGRLVLEDAWVEP